jgi:hypothetical protein
MFADRRLVALSLLAALVAVAPAAVAQDAPTGALDGKTFTVSVTEQGKEPTPDTLTFTAGTFRSTACDEYGFGAASYTTSESDGTVQFSASATSDTEGAITWSGTITGDAVSGSFVWEKEGQDPISYTYEGSLSEASE